MTPPISLFTGQWADLSFEEVCCLASEWGFDGLEIACWGDHLDVFRGATDDEYIKEKLDILAKYNLVPVAISDHMSSQCICDDPIDCRHRDIVSEYVWGDGDPEGVRERAAESLKNAARTASRLGVRTVVGFSESKIWKYVAMFPPVSADVINEGYEDFARRFTPILDVFDEVGVRFALELHPSEIAYDYWTAKHAMEAVGNRPAFGINWDPSHLSWQGVDPTSILLDFADRIYHVHCKGSRLFLNGRNGRMGSHLAWADPGRGWDFVSVGHGDVEWERCFRILNAIGYDGPLSVEWEDAGMDRLRGAPDALAFVRALTWDPPAAAFDAAFSQSAQA